MEAGKYDGGVFISLLTSDLTNENGTTIISDGAYGTNTVEASNVTDAIVLRKSNGIILAAGGVLPGATNPSANLSLLVNQVTTNGDETIVVRSFMSTAENKHSYYIRAHFHGTDGGSDNVFAMCLYVVAMHPLEPVIIDKKIGGSIAGGDIELVYKDPSYELQLTGVAGQTIVWNVTIEYSQYTP